MLNAFLEQFEARVDDLLEELRRMLEHLGRALPLPDESRGYQYWGDLIVPEGDRPAGPFGI